MAVVQLDMFRDSVLQNHFQDYEDFKKKSTNSLRGLFARYNEIEYLILELDKQIRVMREEKTPDTISGEPKERLIFAAN